MWKNKGSVTMEVTITELKEEDLNTALAIWNEVVREANAFPQTEEMKRDEGLEFFASQSFTGTAKLDDKVAGIYILHPNNVGRCAHIANASYAVDKKIRGKHIGRELVKHSLKKARELDFKILQFNAVVRSNKGAIHLYESLGFKKLGVIPKGYLKDDGNYEDIISYIYEL